MCIISGLGGSSEWKGTHRLQIENLADFDNWKSGWRLYTIRTSYNVRANSCLQQTFFMLPSGRVFIEVAMPWKSYPILPQPGRSSIFFDKIQQNKELCG